MVSPSRKDNQLLITGTSFPEEMVTLRNKKKLAALSEENCEGHPRNNLAPNSNVPRSQEDYITQVFEKIEGRVTKKLSQEFSRTKNRILGALARLDDFLMIPLIQDHSVTAPETTRNAFSTSQRTNEDDSQSDPHPEVGIFHNQTAQNSGAEDDHDSNRNQFQTNSKYGPFDIEMNSVTLQRHDYYAIWKFSEGNFIAPRQFRSQIKNESNWFQVYSFST